MLSAAKDLEDYRYLRFDAPFEVWLERVSPKVVATTVLKKRNHFNWWKKRVRDNPQFELFHDFKDKTSFRGVNHTRDAEIFDKLSSLAKRGQIFTLQVDLGSSEQIRSRLIPAVRRIGRPVGTIDLSNAFPFMLSTDQVGTLAQVIAPFGSPNGRVVFHNFRSYIGYSFQKLISTSSVSREGSIPLLYMREGYWPTANSVDNQAPSSSKNCEGLLRCSAVHSCGALFR